MKITSKRHPHRKLVVLDELPFVRDRQKVLAYLAHDHNLSFPEEREWTHFEFKKKPDVTKVKATSVVETFLEACSHIDELKFTDFGDGDFTIEMWAQLPRRDEALEVVEKCKEHTWVYVDGVKA